MTAATGSRNSLAYLKTQHHNGAVKGLAAM